MQKLFFKNRIQEPEEMNRIENNIFERVAKKKYKLWFMPLVDDLLDRAHIKSGNILDVACGPGFLTKELAGRSKNFNIVGIDLSKQAVSSAKENCKKLGNVLFKVGNVNRLPFLEGRFDVVVCRDSLHHFRCPEVALKEMRRVVKRGGLLYIQDLKNYSIIL